MTHAHLTSGPEPAGDGGRSGEPHEPACISIASSPANRNHTLWRLAAHVRGRVLADFRLAVITFCSTLSIVGIVPFAIYRAAIGQWLAAAVDVLILACITGAATVAWTTRHIDRVGLFMVATNSVACLIAATMLGDSGTMWAYAVLLMNFFLVERRPALLASAALVAALMIHGGPFETGVEVGTFVVTTLLVCLYAFVFASRTERQRHQLEALASQDPLTGAGNRRSMERDLAQAISAAETAHTPCAVLILDIDHFKRVNDEHGHEAGDRVLVDFVSILRRNLRRGDRLYRYGGEEFVVLLADTDAAGVNAVVGKLSSQVRQNLISPAGGVTVSIGVAVWHGDEDWSGLLGRADAALFMAKRNGRDCVMWDHPDGGLPHAG